MDEIAKELLKELVETSKDRDMYKGAWECVNKENKELTEKVASLTRLLDEKSIEVMQKKIDSLMIANRMLSGVIHEMDEQRNASIADELAEEYEKQQERVLQNDEPDGIPV